MRTFIAAIILALTALSNGLPAPAACVPARWPSNDIKTLELIAGSPVNCLLLEESNWNAGFNAEAAKHGISTLAVVRPGVNAAESTQRAGGLGFTAIVFEGDFAGALPPVPKPLPSVELTLRNRMKFTEGVPVIGTYQAMWPGIRPEPEDKAHAAASGAAWIDTNAGFLRFARAATRSQIWVAVTPPPRSEFKVERYLQAVGDAAMAGARWVLAFDDSFNKRLLSREEAAIKDWKKIGDHLKYYESHPEWRKAVAHGQMALVQGTESGALVTGGVLDMIATKHTPVRPIPAKELNAESLKGAEMAVAVDPDSLDAAQKEVLKQFTRSGGTVFSGPPGWRFPELKADQITLGEEDTKKLDQIWRELNAMTGRRNLGARLFNVSSMLSNLLGTKDGKLVILHLVNYADYPVENVTVHVLGKYKSARLVRPGGPAVNLEVYPTDEGIGFDIEQVGSLATVELIQ